MTVIVVIDRQRQKFRVYSYRKEYIEYDFNSKVDINNETYIRKYIMSNIDDLTRNKKKYNMYIIATSSKYADGFYNSFIEDNKLKNNINILFTFRPFRKGNYLIID